MAEDGVSPCCSGLIIFAVAQGDKAVRRYEGTGCRRGLVQSIGAFSWRGPRQRTSPRAELPIAQRLSAGVSCKQLSPDARSLARQRAFLTRFHRCCAAESLRKGQARCLPCHSQKNSTTSVAVARDWPKAIQP